jgi:two-component system response regulator AtoC
VHGDKGSVLLIEDDTATADLYALKLRMDGFTVHHAADTATAQVIFKRAHPDVVCVDMRLPDGSGGDAVSDFIGSAHVVLLTNDQAGFERPPEGVSLALLKSRTTPAQLSTTLTRLLAPATN